MRSARGLVLGLALGMSSSACAGAASVEGHALRAPSVASWKEGRRKLAALRAEAQGKGARTLRLGLALKEPVTGRTLEARGAVAIAPPDALRMILLGPGGTTALDLWVRGEKFRFAIPAIDLLRRGDASTPRASMRGLPVDFLSWWLLRPASGTLLWHELDAEGDRFYLREDRAVIELHASRAGRLWARRTTFEVKDARSRRIDEEIVEADRLGCGQVRYRQVSTGLSVLVTCEGEETSRAPSERAFADPDAAPEGGS